jgi:ubiquinone/menaquinone biosynthesis C-methylase UbiE
MADVYSVITQVDPAVIEIVGDAMELRAADPQQQAMLAAYLADVDLPQAASVLEIGCGTGAIARALAVRSGVGEVVGVDPAPGLLARARALSAGHPNLAFLEADGRDLPLPADRFDLVVAHTVLSHVPEPERAVAEAHRTLRPGGTLAVFDGDYATITVAAGEHDPLQACAQAFVPAFINDPWAMRRMPAVVRATGFTDLDVRSHGYVQIDRPAYMTSIVDRGADALVAAGLVGPDLAAALKAEARRRATNGRFLGHIAYTSILARKPR